MFRLLTTAALTKDLKPTSEDVETDADTVQWYGHRVTIERRKCVVLMEATTRYGLLFAGMTKPDFQRLDERLRERVPLELGLLHDDAGLAERFRPAVERLADPTVIEPGRDRSVQAHINDFVQNVRVWVSRNYRLPNDDEESFRAALHANWMLKMGKNYPQGLISISAFREMWMREAGIEADALPEPIDPWESVWAGLLPRSDTGTFQLSIELLDIEPPIWRRIRVPTNLPLEGLHDVIQIAMGWLDYHLHEFTDGTRRYGQPHGEWPGEELADEREFRLDQLMARPGDRLDYVYDFGDDWHHRLTLEAIDPPGAHAERLACLDGARRRPPEDVGGTWGYIEFLEAVLDPAHPEHTDMLRWAGGEFDPEDFDAEEVNADLAAEFGTVPQP